MSILMRRQRGISRAQTAATAGGCRVGPENSDQEMSATRQI